MEVDWEGKSQDGSESESSVGEPPADLPTLIWGQSDSAFWSSYHSTYDIIKEPEKFEK